MKGKIGTRAKIPPGSRRHIIARAIAHPRIPRRELAKKLQYELETMGYDVPEIEVLERIISRKRNEITGLPKDKPWCLGCLEEYPLPPEALPAVMSCYKRRLAGGSLLTIREALWAARLYKVIDSPGVVWGWASLYASEEMISELMGKETFNSEVLDLEIAKCPRTIPPIVRDLSIWRIAEKYGADPYKLRDLNLSIEETEEIVKSNPEKFAAKKTFYLSDWPNKDTIEFMDKLNEPVLVDGSIKEWIKVHKYLLEGRLTFEGNSTKGRKRRKQK